MDKAPLFFDTGQAPPRNRPPVWMSHWFLISALVVVVGVAVLVLSGVAADATASCGGG